MTTDNKNTKDGNYRCQDCDTEFRDQQEYDRHYAKDHEGHYRPQQASARMQQGQ